MHAIASRRVVALAAALSALIAPSCDKKDGPSPAASSTATTASALAPSVAAGQSIKFVIDAKGTSSIDMPAPKEHIKADTSAASGSLDVDLANLANTRGEVKIDLSTLKTHTFGNDQDTTQTTHALTWLEVGGNAPQEVREPNRWVSYAIRSIDGLSATDVTKVAPTKEGSDDVRTVTLTAHGDFLLHGKKVADKEAALEVKFHYPSGAAPDSKPSRIDITSKAPLHVILADHDVKPRDNVGKIAQSAFGLLGTKVAETADVMLNLTAAPAP